MTHISIGKWRIDVFYVVAVAACIVLAFFLENVLDILVAGAIITSIGAGDAYFDYIERKESNDENNLEHH